MFETDGASLFAMAGELGLEGIIAKKLDSPYRSGRGGEWQKIKCIQKDTFVVIGYEPSSSDPGAVGSSLLAARKGDRLAFVGSVGTGFTDKQARKLMVRLKALQTKTSVLKMKTKSAVT